MAGGFAEAFKATRKKAVELEEEEKHSLFRSAFKMKVGDYLEVVRGNSPRISRIINVENCYWNAGGGVTANLHLACLTRDGRLSTSRGVTIAIGGKDKKLRGVSHDVRALSTPIA